MSEILINKWKICRICMKKDDNKFYTIFSTIEEEPIICEFLDDLKEKIEKVGDIQLLCHANLPNQICSRCVLLLRGAIKFRELCQNSDLQFKEFTQSLKVVSTVNIRECKTEKDDHTEIGTVDYTAEQLPEEDHVMHEDVMEVNDDDEEIIETYDVDEIEEAEKDVYTNTDDSVQELIEKTQWDFNQSEHFETVNEEDNTNSDIEFVVTKKQQQTRERKRVVLLPNKDGSYDCSFCANTYLNKAKLSQHLRMHADKKRHECEICGKAFSSTPQLSRHMNSHTGNRPYKCKFCSASFADPSTKIKHERIHTNERPYKCNLCDKAFAYSNVLKIHMMIHTGERPHSCAYCNKKFSQLHHKNAHEKRHSTYNEDYTVKR